MLSTKADKLRRENLKVDPSLLLASGSRDNTIKLWDVSSGSELHTLKGHCDFVLSIAFSPNGKLLATGGRDSVITLWEVNSRRELISRNA